MRKKFIFTIIALSLILFLLLIGFVWELTSINPKIGYVSLLIFLIGSGVASMLIYYILNKTQRPSDSYYFDINKSTDIPDEEFKLRLHSIKEKLVKIIEGYLDDTMEIVNSPPRSETKRKEKNSDIVVKLKNCTQGICDHLDFALSDLLKMDVAVHIKYFPPISEKNNAEITSNYELKDDSRLQTLVMSNVSVSRNKDRKTVYEHPIGGNTPFLNIKNGANYFYVPSISKLSKATSEGFIQYKTTARHPGKNYNSQFVYPIRGVVDGQEIYMGFLVLDSMKQLFKKSQESIIVELCDAVSRKLHIFMFSNMMAQNLLASKRRKEKIELNFFEEIHEVYKSLIEKGSNTIFIALSSNGLNLIKKHNKELVYSAIIQKDDQPVG